MGVRPHWHGVHFVHDDSRFWLRALKETHANDPHSALQSGGIRAQGRRGSFDDETARQSRRLGLLYG